jgi:hypothetical protein
MISWSPPESEPMIAKIQQLEECPLSIYPSIHPVKCCLPNAAHHALKSGMIHHPWPQFSHVPNPWPYLSLSNGGLPGRFKFKQPQVHNRILPYSAYSIFFYHRHFFVSDLGGFFMYVTHCHTYSSSMGAAGIVGKKKGNLFAHCH